MSRTFPPAATPAGAPPMLTDGVVTLRGHRPEDVDAIIRQGRDAAMQRWTRVPIPYERRDAMDFLAYAAMGWRTGSEYHFAIAEPAGFAGSLDLRVHEPGAAEIGFGLGPWARGHGVMARAVRIALRWGFGAPGLHVVHWRAQVGNWASRRVAWATGFRVEGTVRGLLTQRGERVDGWIGSIRRTDPLRPAHAWLDPPRLRSENLLLRAHVDADLPRIVQACRDPDTRFWLGGLPSPYAEQDARDHLASIRSEQASGRGMYWVVADGGAERLAGEIGLFVRDDAGRQGEVGYWAHPEQRSRGLTTEATRLVVRHALLPRDVGGLGMDRVLLRVAAGNQASLRVAEKVGFRRIGVERRADLLRDGTLSDDIRFDLIADELPPAADLPGNRPRGRRGGPP